MLDNVPGRASGIGSWPGVEVAETARTTFGELVEPSIPYLPELPGRGPGGDLIGRTATFLVDTAVDLQPSGWRLVSRPGRDLERAQSMLRQDLDVLAEVADGYIGPLKLQVAGPWTLAGSLYLPRLERAVVDPGACRDVIGSLAEGLSLHIAQVRRLVPGATVVVQLDEPSLPAVLQGSLPTASGWGRLRAVGETVAVDGLRSVLEAAVTGGAVETVVHCCAADPPLELLLRSGVDGLSLDVSTLRRRHWETLAAALEAGRRLWAGAVPTTTVEPTGTGSTGTGSTGTGRTAAAPDAASAFAASVAESVWVPWRKLGLAAPLVAGVIVTPTCGLATATPARARAALLHAVRGARELALRAQE